MEKKMLPVPKQASCSKRKDPPPSHNGIKKSVCTQQLPLAVLPPEQAQMAPFLAMMHPHPSYYAPVPPHIHHMPHANHFCQAIWSPLNFYGQCPMTSNNTMIDCDGHQQ